MTDDGLSDLTNVAFLNLKNHNFIQSRMSGWALVTNTYKKFVIDPQHSSTKQKQKEIQHEYRG